MNTTEAAWRFIVDECSSAGKRPWLEVLCGAPKGRRRDCETVVAQVWDTPHGLFVVSTQKNPRRHPYQETREQEKRWQQMGLGRTMGLNMGLLDDSACPPIRAECPNHGSGSGRDRHPGRDGIPRGVTMTEDGLAFVADKEFKALDVHPVELDKQELRRRALLAKANNRPTSPKVHQLALRSK